MRQAGEEGLVNLAAGVPGWDALPAEALRAACMRAMASGGASVFAYHHPEGDRALREVIAHRLSGKGAEIDGSQVVTVTGCTQALHLMLALLVAPGDVVACEAPAYYGLLELLSQAGARVLPIPVRGADGVDLAETDEMLSRWKPRCMVVCSALSNPSGATMPDSSREALVEICRRNGVSLIEDDIYGELLDAPTVKPMLAWDRGGRTVSYVSSFSKSVSPGLRVGMCVPGIHHEDFARRKCQHDLHSSVLSEATLREFLNAGAFDSHLDTLRARNRRRRQIALGAISRTFPGGTRAVEPAGGYMLWVELPESANAANLRERAKAERVVFADGAAFFAEPQGSAFLRLNCAKASEGELVQGIETLGALLQSEPAFSA